MSYHCYRPSPDDSFIQLRNRVGGCPTCGLGELYEVRVTQDYRSLAKHYEFVWRCYCLVHEKQRVAITLTAQFELDLSRFAFDQISLSRFLIDYLAASIAKFKANNPIQPKDPRTLSHQERLVYHHAGYKKAMTTSPVEEDDDPADFIVPDEVEPRLGWRWFRVGGPSGPFDHFRSEYWLWSLHKSHRWEPRQPAVALCHVGRSHRSPAKNCSCGFYALDTRERLLKGDYATPGPRYVLAEMNLWGKIVPGEKGNRAEKAYPRKLYVCDTIEVEALKGLTERYDDVPFEFYSRTVFGGVSTPSAVRLKNLGAKLRAFGKTATIDGVLCPLYDRYRTPMLTPLKLDADADTEPSMPYTSGTETLKKMFEADLLTINQAKQMMQGMSSDGDPPLS